MAKTFASLSRASRAAARGGNIPRSVRRLFPSVTRLVDATESIEVSITPRDCGRGSKPGDATACAMARAFERQHEADGAIIGLTRAYVVTGNTVTRFVTPVTVGREITSFDRNADFEPGNYHLAPMPPMQQTAGRAGGKRTKRGSGRRIVHKATVRVRSLAGL